MPSRLACQRVARASIAASAILAASCQWWGASGPLRSAAAVQAERRAGATVELAGQVRQRAPFVSSGAYQLVDDSGTVWVVTGEAELPAVGDRLRVRGTVDYRSVPAEGQEWGGAFVREGERQRESE